MNVIQENECADACVMRGHWCIILYYRFRQVPLNVDEALCPRSAC
ncbi:hypothetical protein [Prevotella sp. HUN102]|nr:hypothetical protein [Prevotella sp. HUN102]